MHDHSCYAGQLQLVRSTGSTREGRSVVVPFFLEFITCAEEV